MRVIRVNMQDLNVAIEKLPDNYQKLSGRALTSRIVSDEVSPTCHPLGPNNKLIIANGFLAGSTVSSSGRISIGAKSPLTLGIKESNGGGTTAQKMGRLGIRSIIIEGKVQKEGWYMLYINKEEVKLVDGTYLKGKGVYEKAQLLQKRYGKKIGIILIGPAGERLAITAGITNTDKEGVPSRYCGRGGLGAVMGSKRILAIVLDDTGTALPKPIQPEEFKKLSRELHTQILNSPVTGQSYPKYGTAAMLEVTNAIGGLPTRNFSTGTFEGADKINGQALYDTITQRGGEGNPTHACMTGCIIRCSNCYPDQEGKILVSPIEYETISLIGSNCGIDDLDVIAKLNYICNDYGIDTIEFGCALGVLMEAGVLAFGDGEKMLEIAQEMVKGSYLGRIITAGSVITGRVFGVTRVPAVKGQGMAAYEPRGIKGTGVTYMTSPMGADHTAGNTVKLNMKHHQKEGQVEASLNAQRTMALIDSLGLCIMVGGKDKKLLANLVNSFTGLDFTEKELENMAEETLNIEKNFNKAAGLTQADDLLPEFFYLESNPANGAVFDISYKDLE